MKRSIPLVLVVLALTALLAAHLFRFRSWTQEQLGEVTLRYRWGRPYLLELDVNGDALIDARYRLSGSRGHGSSHWNWTEGWESTHCDGIMDLRLRMDSGKGLVVWFDRDRDVLPDHEFVGTAAEEFLKTMHRDGCGNPQHWQQMIAPKDSQRTRP